MGGRGGFLWRVTQVGEARSKHLSVRVLLELRVATFVSVVVYDISYFDTSSK
jgi:hypothetical protein